MSNLYYQHSQPGQNVISKTVRTQQIIRLGSFLKKAEKLLSTDIHWENQRQLAEIWQPKLTHIQRQKKQLETLEQPILIVVVAGGVKAGKSHIANIMAGQPLFVESIRHETRQAGVSLPAAISRDSAISLLEPLKEEWLEILSANTQYADRQLLLIDLPDFDSESQLPQFSKNQAIAAAAMSVADVIVMVSSQAHNLTEKLFSWLTQFREAHGFLFVYNETHGVEGDDARLRTEQLQKQISLAGFSNKSLVVHVPYNPERYTAPGLAAALQKLPANHTIRSWRVGAQLRQMLADIEETYQNVAPDISATVDSVRKNLLQPYHVRQKQHLELQLQKMEGSIQRELVFTAASQIGGIFGGFVTLRRFFSYWSLPGLWLGPKLLKGAPGLLLAGGSLLAGSVSRRIEKFRDKKNLAAKDITDVPKTHSPDLESINLELENVHLDPIPPQTGKTHLAGDAEMTAQLSETVVHFINAELFQPSKNGRIARFGKRRHRFIWNILPTLLIIFMFFQIISSLFLPQSIRSVIPFPVGMATNIMFYINMLAVVFSFCYLEYYLMQRLFRNAGRRTRDKILQALTEFEHPLVQSVNERLAAPGQWRISAKKLNFQLEKLLTEIQPYLDGIEIK